MSQENNRIELYQKVMHKERHNKNTNKNYRIYTKDYPTFIKQFFDKSINTDSLYDYLISKSLYSKSKTSF